MRHTGRGMPRGISQRKGDVSEEYWRKGHCVGPVGVLVDQNTKFVINSHMVREE